MIDQRTEAECSMCGKPLIRGSLADGKFTQWSHMGDWQPRHPAVPAESVAPVPATTAAPTPDKCPICDTEGHVPWCPERPDATPDTLVTPAPEAPPNPVPMELWCPSCHALHIDEGEWATRHHKTHQCQVCGHEWRPYEYATVGVATKVLPDVATPAPQPGDSGWLPLPDGPPPNTNETYLLAALNPTDPLGTRLGPQVTSAEWDNSMQAWCDANYTLQWIPTHYMPTAPLLSRLRGQEVAG